MLRSLAGGSLFGEVWGQTPASVLALHGWARSHDDFTAALRAPLEGDDPSDGGRGVLAPDLPGFGATPEPDEAWGSQDYAEALVALYSPDSASAGPMLRPSVVVVGHSFGGRVALHLAASHPELVSALVLTGVPMPIGATPAKRPPAGYRLVRGLHRLGVVGSDRMERARLRYGSPDYLAAQGVMRGVLVRVLAERYDEQLARLRCPVELVWADDDTAAPLEMAIGVAERLPGAVLTRCGPVGHLTPVTAAPALRAAVRRALANLA